MTIIQVEELYRRIAELERMVFPLDPPYQYVETQPCLLSLVDHGKNQVIGLACSCPRCSPR